MIPDARHLLFAALSGILLSYAAISFVGCRTQHAGDADAATAEISHDIRQALDTYALVLQPVWRGANEVCAARYDAIATDVEKRRLTPEEGDRQLTAATVGCKQRDALFRWLKDAQDQAATLVEAGKVEDAALLLAQIRTRWQSLGDGAADGGTP